MLSGSSDASYVMGIPTPATERRLGFLVRNTKMLHIIADGNSRAMLVG